MLKNHSRIPNRDIYIITKSPPDQNSNPKIKLKETIEEVIPLKEHKSAIIVFEEILVSSNCKSINQFS